MERNLILIHGMGRLKWSMIHLVPIAKRKGFIPVIFEYRAKERSITEHANSLCRFIEERCNPELPFCFLTHSLGGIITRFALQVSPFTSVAHAPRVVMLGPPNRGSLVAKKLRSISLLKGRFGSPFQELAEGAFPPLQSNVEVGIIAGVISHRFSFHPWYEEPNDTLVSVSETMLDGCKDHRIIRCPHAVLQYSPTAIRYAFNFFEHGSFT